MRWILWPWKNRHTGEWSRGAGIHGGHGAADIGGEAGQGVDVGHAFQVLGGIKRVDPHPLGVSHARSSRAFPLSCLVARSFHFCKSGCSDMVCSFVKNGCSVSNWWYRPPDRRYLINILTQTRPLISSRFYRDWKWPARPFRKACWPDRSVGPAAPWRSTW
jgi:hypothetical protein